MIIWKNTQTGKHYIEESIAELHDTNYYVLRGEDLQRILVPCLELGDFEIVAMFTHEMHKGL